MPTDTGIRDRLKEVRDKATELRAERNTAKAERDAAKQAFADANHDIANVTEWPEFKAAEEATARVGRIDDELNDLGNAEKAILKMLGESGSDPETAAAAAHASLEQRSGGWDSHRLLAGEDSEYQQALKRGVFTSQHQFGTIELGRITSREEAAAFLSPMQADLPTGTGADVGTPGGTVVPYDRRGIQGFRLRQLRMIDLLPQGTTDSNTIEYVQVQTIPGSAAETAELAIKPAEGLSLGDATAPVRTIAGWIKVARQALDDMAALRTLIDTLLPFDVRRRIDNQVINGNGVGQNLKGILAQTGLGNAPFQAGDNPADAILRAMTVTILSDAEPNFVAIYPTVWQDLLLTREAGGATGSGRTGTYLYGGPGSIGASPGVPTVWGLVMTPSIAIPATTPLVGDSNGASLLWREGINIRVSDSDQDDFVRNRVTLLCEGRVALPVWRPASFTTAHTA
jgi:HK97 family phage major capsid protein